MADLYIDAPSMTGQIESLIRDAVSRLHRDGAIIAFSGGLDSSVAVVLTVRSLAKDKVKLLYLPDRDSNPLHGKHAAMLAGELGCAFSVQNISPVLWKLGSYRTLLLGYIPTRLLRKLALKFGRKHFVTTEPRDYAAARLRPGANSLFSRTNAYMESKHRVRMAKIYQVAEVQNLLVVGAANRTEWMTGNFSHWGIDHCADVMPLVHLYRTQVEQLAEYLDLPEYIRKKPADPDVMPIEDDKGKLLGGFKSVDRILFDMESGIPLEQLNRSHDPSLVQSVMLMHEYSRHMRESPYHLPLHHQTLPG